MKILAISGGIDSVVMLDFLYSAARPSERNNIIVAHFDHGIRENSAEDCDFVRRLAEQKYHLECITERAELGASCSESLARERRYAFLNQLAQMYGGEIYVAHHADDVLESIAINIIRGTGWRGLTPMQQTGIVRPLLSWPKEQIYRYATEHALSFRQDPTNVEDAYLRNRVRQKMRALSEEQRTQILSLYSRQAELRKEIDEIIESIISDSSRCQRSTIVDSPVNVAHEMLRYFLGKNHIFLTRPQLHRCYMAIRDYSPGKRFSLDAQHFLKIDKYSFYVEPGATA